MDRIRTPTCLGCPHDLHFGERLPRRQQGVTMRPGENETGEIIYISICHLRIAVKTLQETHWARVNTYYRDGACSETFDGKWA